jgi:hypothetical protein
MGLMVVSPALRTRFGVVLIKKIKADHKTLFVNPSHITLLRVAGSGWRKGYGWDDLWWVDMTRGNGFSIFKSELQQITEGGYRR